MKKSTQTYNIEDLNPSKVCWEWCVYHGFTNLEELFSTLTMTQLATSKGMTIVIFRELTTMAYTTGLSPKLNFD
jgi:hypothetical protein